MYNKRFIITEEERRSILGQYGLLKEEPQGNTYGTHVGFNVPGIPEKDFKELVCQLATKRNGFYIGSNGVNQSNIVDYMYMGTAFDSPKWQELINKPGNYDQQKAGNVSKWSVGVWLEKADPSGQWRKWAAECLKPKSNTTTKTVTKELVKPKNAPDTKVFQQWVINTKGDKTILGKGGDSGFGDDGRWGLKTDNAWKKYGEDYELQTKTAFQGVSSTEDGSDETFDAPISASQTTKSQETVKKPEITNVTPTQSNQTLNTADNLNSRSPREIRRDFRQQKREDRKDMRQAIQQSKNIQSQIARGRV